MPNALAARLELLLIRHRMAAEATEALRRLKAVLQTGAPDRAANGDPGPRATLV
jgi:hypothetical protein